MHARVGEHTGYDHAVRNRTPRSARASMWGVDGARPCLLNDERLSTPRSSATKIRMLSLCAGASCETARQAIPAMNRTGKRSAHTRSGDLPLGICCEVRGVAISCKKYIESPATSSERSPWLFTASAPVCRRRGRLERTEAPGEAARVRPPSAPNRGSRPAVSSISTSWLAGRTAHYLSRVNRGPRSPSPRALRAAGDPAGCA